MSGALGCPVFMLQAYRAAWARRTGAARKPVPLNENTPAAGWRGTRRGRLR